MKVKAIRGYKYADSSGTVWQIDPGMILDVPDSTAKEWIRLRWAIEEKN
jgi:hypothetical protein